MLKYWFLIQDLALLHWHMLPCVGGSFTSDVLVMFQSQVVLGRGYCSNILNRCSHSSSIWLLRNKAQIPISPPCSANYGICYSMGRWCSKSKNFPILTPIDGLFSNWVNMFPRGVAYSVYQLVAPPVILPVLWHCLIIAGCYGQVDILVSESHQLNPLK